MSVAKSCATSPNRDIEESLKMSRVGKMPVTIPAGVDVSIKEDQISVKGSGGTLSLHRNLLVKVVSNDGKLNFEPANDSREANAMSGTLRQLVNNMVVGVTKGFEKKLNLVGVGYKAAASNNKLNLQVGYSHPVNIEMPQGITVTTATPTEIVIKGADRQRVGQIAAEIRAVRPPEPYKGKGIRYSDEKIVIKETKKK
ncbi:large subunit ribosomal protein L6 [Variovorax sp. GrIS 2.14]